ncbi:S1/P1 nuclease [Pseudohongiella sp.]|uniref:Endonuclease n=1 Tax=marine sediment metagenome TaxID=412755 RepID=A0A0F9WJ34_9ZZZZ|nr:S1/P1 nuclease [Pseudohongiella sp.]
MSARLSLAACVRTIVLLTTIALPSLSQAWDATGHRLAAYVAYQTLTAPQRDYWLDVLQQHPRYAPDFADAMPQAIRAASREEQSRWLLGQAAVWPDLARGLPDAIRSRYNQPDWHWIDGAWVRDDAQTQGNVYLDTAPQPDIQGAPANNSQHASHASNVVTALERAHWQLAHETDAAQRAIALCWLLHLIGDIHQPLHTGGLVSSQLFPNGDRGGNAIRTRGSNLHAVWDQALRGPALNNSLMALNALATSVPRTQAFTPTQWLHESRSILLQNVYPDSIIENVRLSENTGSRLDSVTLRHHYEADMKQTAAIRLAEAGVRISNTLANISGTP